MQILEDSEIIALFRQRSQDAISAAQHKYGALCINMAANLTGSRQDAEECLNDALLRLWDSIPPNMPESLGGYLMTVCRRLALDCRKSKMREKRGSGQAELAFDELAGCIASPDQPEALRRLEKRDLRISRSAARRGKSHVSAAVLVLPFRTGSRR